ncbi:thiamine biosynthesis protein [Vulgatibacter incomptus]|uniref:tRNA (5-methylaminomethyl-2-thiouridylate)-methyltransferase n=1 Tax=Vulgatibacter incomptus TaxID=1391653 RepID=A0A0K1PC42_9BACT|nr:thiamine biosynthesis protein [Vulgatibacter incomptus]AKU91072.1 tRNA (5-methylaminomethyl-2-thiouridylate)-methyltransferase [Vulgatibacter incomptus]
MTKRKAKALGLISGGLDSMLALRIVRDVLGCEVRAVNFYTGFCITETQRRRGTTRADGTVKPNEALVAGAELHTEVELIDISDKGYLDVIANPKYGYGANANPCVDCRIDMFQRARQLLDEWGGDFIFTGEVLGQRPKSQRRHTMALIEKNAGLEGRLLRPLSAKLLPPTRAEEEGLIDREKLLDFSGRGRKPQIALAEELRLGSFPQPAGGCCYLTDETFARKFFDILDHREERRIEKEEILLLASGRHFRLSPRTKLIVGRTEGENFQLERHAEGRYLVAARDHAGPVALVEGEPTWEEMVLASRIVARYGKGKGEAEVLVEWKSEGGADELRVEPFLDDAAFEPFRI